MKSYSLFFNLLFLILSPLLSYGQLTVHEKDSLLHQLPTQTGIQKMSSIHLLVSQYYLSNNPDSARYFSDQLLVLANKNKNPEYQAYAYKNLSKIHLYNSEYNPAIDLLNQAINIQKEGNMTLDLADSYKALAGIYFQSDRPKKAIELSFKALDLYEHLNNTKGIIASYNNIGLLYKEAKNPSKALAYYHKAIQTIDQKKIKKNKAGLFTNMGLILRNQHPDSSLYYYRKAINEDVHFNDKRSLSNEYYNMANLYAFNLKNLDSSEYYYKKSFALAKSVNKNIVRSVYSAMGKMYYEHRQFSKSIQYSNKALDLAKTQQDWVTLELSNYYLYKAFKAQNKWKKASNYLEAFVDARDTLSTRNAKIAIANLESKYENEKNTLQIKALKNKQKKDFLIKWLLSIGFVFAILLVFMIIRINKHKKEEYVLMKEKLDQEVRYKTRQLTSQALMMMQKNKLLDDLLKALSDIKDIGITSNKQILQLKRKLKHSLHSEKDWELFKHYFEDINKDFFVNLKKINNKITPSELKLSALIKLRFTIKETASLLNLSPESVKTARYVLRKKLHLSKGENFYDFFNRI